MNKLIINLISSALLGKEITVENGVDFEKLYRFASKQQISVMIYYGLLKAKIDLPKDIRAKFEQNILIQSAISGAQLYEIKKLSSAFEDNGIDYMLLKGTVLKNIYPKPEMRQMSDADILIKPEQTEKISQLMLELGYIYKYESDHEIVWAKSSKVTIELHKRLIPSYNKDFYNYYGDGWRLAKGIEGRKHEYQLNSDDNFIYVFTHFAKHYRDAGVGARHMVDIYMLKKHIKDISYVEKELNELQLYDFYCNVNKTLDVWFENGIEDEITNIITNRIFLGGAYGTDEAHILSDAVKKSKSTGSAKKAAKSKIFNMIFLSREYLQKEYKILNKLPFLLPIFWVWHRMTALLFRRKNVKMQLNAAMILKNDKINGYQDELNAVGLDFNFKD